MTGKSILPANILQLRDNLSLVDYCLHLSELHSICSIVRRKETTLSCNSFESMRFILATFDEFSSWTTA